MPVLATDNFNRADEAPLSGGGVWSAPFGTPDAMKIVTNAVQMTTPADDGGSIYTGVTWPNDQYGQVVLTDLFSGAIDETGIGIALRYTDTTHFYRCVVNKNASTNVTVERR